MSILDRLFVTEARAVEAGLTHEGTMFGVPAWITVTDEDVFGCPKVVALQAWCWLCDLALDFGAGFIPTHKWLEMPFTVGRKL